MNKILLYAGYLCLVSSLFLSCQSDKSYTAVTVGEEEDLIKKGDMTTHITLKELEGKPNLYGIGSVTNLKGFIVIDNGKPITSSVQGGEVVVDSSWNTEATLMVYSQGDQWKEVEIPASVKTFKDVEAFVLTSAEENDINPDSPFPFLLKGIAETIQWRVTDWDPNDKQVTNKKVKNSGLKGIANSVNTTIVGYYCTKQYRVLADRNSKMHLHFASNDRRVSGHIDDMTVNGRMKLYLPLEESK